MSNLKHNAKQYIYIELNMPYCRNEHHDIGMLDNYQDTFVWKNLMHLNVILRYNYKAVKLRIVRFRYGETDA